MPKPKYKVGDTVYWFNGIIDITIQSGTIELIGKPNEEYVYQIEGGKIDGVYHYDELLLESKAFTTREECLEIVKKMCDEVEL